MAASARSLQKSPVAKPAIEWSPLVRILVLAAIAAAMIFAFMTLESRGNWDFVLPFRARKLAALAVVGCSVAISTVSFQTITGNRLLTPGIMGLDALYLFFQSIAVFLFGSSTLIMIDPRIRFGIEVLAMVAFAGLLFWWLFVRSRFDLHLLLLVGVVFGILFRSMTGFILRMIDPAEYIFLQDIFFASFSAVDQTLLTVSAVIVATGGLIVWRMNHTLDAMLLGRQAAVGLGVDYQQTVMIAFSVIATLMAVSTALVGPITFMGLLVAFLAYGLAGSWKHRYVLPVSCLLSVILLVGGQTLLERVFAFNTTLPIIIEFVGGVVFLILLFRGRYT